MDTGRQKMMKTEKSRIRRGGQREGKIFDKKVIDEMRVMTHIRV